MLMDIIKARHSIRKYTKEQISRVNLDKILEAGNFAPNAGGGQRSMMVAVHNSEMAAYLGRMNLARFNRSNLSGSYVSAEQPSVIDDRVPENYTCQCFVILGYIDGSQPASKPRKSNRLVVVE